MSVSSSPRTEIPSLHALKTLAALGVIMIHCIGSPVREPLLHLCKLAVPIFFMITGFFLTDADEEVLRGSRIKKMLFKTLRLTFIIQVFYLALKWVSMPPAQVASFYTSMRHADYWVHFLLIGDNFCGPLWYLHALIECLIVLYVVAQQHQVRLIWILGGIGFLLNMALGKFAFVWHPEHFDFYIHRNALTIGLPALACGMWMRQHGAAWFRRLSEHRRFWLMCVALCLLTAENGAYFLAGIRGYGDISLLTLPTAIITFGWALYSSRLGHCRFLVFVGRNLSMYLYLFHSAVIVILSRFQLLLTIGQWLEVSAVTLLVSAVVYEARRRMRILRSAPHNPDFIVGEK